MFDDQQRPIGVRFANGDTIGLTLDEFGRQVDLDVAGARWVTERGQRRSDRQARRPDGTRIDPDVRGAGAMVRDRRRRGGDESPRDRPRPPRHVAADAGRDRRCHLRGDRARAQRDRRRTDDDATTHTRPVVAWRRSIERTGTTECRYDEAGQLVATNNGRGWWTFDRDATGGSPGVCRPQGANSATSTTFSATSRSIEVDGAVWRFDYDPMGRVVQSTDPTGTHEVVRLRRDGPDGRIARRSRPCRCATSTTSAAASPRWSTQPAGRFVTSTTPTGQLTSIVDQLGRQTVVRYDAAGRHVGTDYARP